MRNLKDPDFWMMILAWLYIVLLVVTIAALCMYIMTLAGFADAGGAVASLYPPGARSLASAVV